MNLGKLLGGMLSSIIGYGCNYLVNKQNLSYVPSCASACRFALFIIVSYMAATSSSFAATQTHWNYYSQSQYQSHTQNYVTQQRLRYVFGPDAPLRAYVGMQFEMDTRSDSSAIYNDNFVTPTLGIKWLPIVNVGLVVYSEVHYLFRLGSLSTTQMKSEFDWRNGVYFYGFRDYRISPRINGFLESYSDLYFIYKADRNLILNTWVKSGFRVFRNLPQVDIYLEGIAKRNRKKFEWENLSELRWGLRGRFSVAGLFAAASLDRTLKFDGAASQRVPWRAQVALSGEF